jgi:hypothetical protein
VLVKARAAQKRFLLQMLDKVWGAKRRRRFFSGFFAQQLILMENPTQQRPFEVPEAYLRDWGMT